MADTIAVLNAGSSSIKFSVFAERGGEPELNSPSLRERVCRDAAWLEVELDPAANDRHGPCISTDGSRVSAWVIPTDEEQMIARHRRRVLAEG